MERRHQGGSTRPLDLIVCQVDQLYQERDRQSVEMQALRESVAASEIQCRASRETVMRLVSEVRCEQATAAAQAEELQTLKKDFEDMLQSKKCLETENKHLRESVETSQKEISNLQRRCREMERSGGEAQAAQALLQAFGEEVTAVLGPEGAGAAGAQQEDFQRKLRERHSRKDVRSDWDIAHLEVQLLQILGQLFMLKSSHKEAWLRAENAEVQAQEVSGRLEELEAELLSADVICDGLRREQQDTQRFLEQLSETMKLDGVTADIGLDMRLQAILLCAERLVKHEGVTAVESRTMVHNLQRKLKLQRERVESKELHVDMLRKKVAQLEEEKRSRSTLAVERDDAHVEAQRLQKKANRLQRELKIEQLANKELKAQLYESGVLKVKVLEQTQTIEDQTKNLEKLKDEKVIAAKSLTIVKSELQSRCQQAKDRQQQAQKVLESNAGELHSLRRMVAHLAEKETQLLDFRKLVSEMLGLDMNSLALPEYEIIKKLEVLLHGHCHPPHKLACQAHTCAKLPPNKC